MAAVVEEFRQHLHDLELDQVTLPGHASLVHAINVVVELETWCWGLAASQYFMVEDEQRELRANERGPVESSVKRLDWQNRSFFGEAVISSADMAGVEPPTHERIHVDG